MNPGEKCVQVANNYEIHHMVLEENCGTARSFTYDISTYSLPLMHPGMRAVSGPAWHTKPQSTPAGKKGYRVCYLEYITSEVSSLSPQA